MEVAAAQEATTAVRCYQAMFVVVWRSCRSDLLEFDVEMWLLAVVGRRWPRRNSELASVGARLFGMVRDARGGSPGC